MYEDIAQGRTQDLELGGTPVAISARAVLKVRPHTIEKWGGGGGSPLQVRYTKSGGGGGAVHFRPDIRKVGVGGQQSTSGPIYEKWGGGAVHFRPDIRKVGVGGQQSTSGPIYEKSGGGGGGGGQSTSGPIPLFGTQKIPTCTYLRTT